jgi:dihydroorotase-like cyclic amidohydrolase
VFGLKRKGTIAVGQDADFLLLAPENTPLQELRASDMLTRVGWSPFEGMAMVPRPQRVYVGGRLVAANGAIVGDDVRGALVRPG